MKMLEPFGFRTITASNANEALTHLMEDTFDLLITDIEMPGKDGITLINEAKGLLAKLPFIIICSGAPREYILDDLLTDSIRFLQKPFASLELYRLLNSYFLGRFDNLLRESNAILRDN